MLQDPLAARFVQQTELPALCAEGRSLGKAALSLLRARWHRNEAKQRPHPAHSMWPPDLSQNIKNRDTALSTHHHCRVVTLLPADPSQPQQVPSLPTNTPNQRQLGAELLPVGVPWVQPHVCPTPRHSPSLVTLWHPGHKEAVGGSEQHSCCQALTEGHQTPTPRQPSSQRWYSLRSLTSPLYTAELKLKFICSDIFVSF